MKINLMVASSCQHRLASWTSELSGLVGLAIVIGNSGVLKDDVVRHKPNVMLLDHDLLDLNDLGNLSQICPETKIVIVGADISEEVEWELLKAGVKGCCRNDASPKLLKQVVMAVYDGELWIRRTLTCRLIDELGRTTAKHKAYRDSLEHLNKLTQREYDIAVRVGNGESNKLIAKACGITERTVKAHLTEVFQKLGVTDRLNLALVLSAGDRVSDRKSPRGKLTGALDIDCSAIPSHSGF